MPRACVLREEAAARGSCLRVARMREAEREMRR